jgi:hypothetical protein
MTKMTAACATLILGLSVGCSPKYYVPNTQNVPLISAQGQSTASVAGNGNQVEFQGAVGLSNALALQVNAGVVMPKTEDNGDGGSGRLIEAGLGYFRNVTPNVLFDVYALAGVGRMENDFPSTLDANPGTTGMIKADIVRFGLQPSLSYHTRHFSVSGSTRVSSLRYNNIEGDLIFGGVNQVDYLTEHKSSVLLEPALTLRAGWDAVKLQLQVARSINLTTSDFKQDESLVTAGVTFRFR